MLTREDPRLQALRALEKHRQRMIATDPPPRITPNTPMMGGQDDDWRDKWQMSPDQWRQSQRPVPQLPPRRPRTPTPKAPKRMPDSGGYPLDPEGDDSWAGAVNYGAATGGDAIGGGAAVMPALPNLGTKKEGEQFTKGMQSLATAFDPNHGIQKVDHSKIGVAPAPDPRQAAAVAGMQKAISERAERDQQSVEIDQVEMANLMADSEAYDAAMSVLGDPALMTELLRLQADQEELGIARTKLHEDRRQEIDDERTRKINMLRTLGVV